MGKIKRYAIILAGGTGQRYSSDIHKQFIKVAGKSIIEHTLNIFEKHKKIDEIFIVTHPNNRNYLEEIIINNNYRKVKKILNGGDNRRESSGVGVNAINDDNAYVLIHDAVRPFLSLQIIDSCFDALKKFDAVDVAIPSSDTIIEVDNNHIISSIPERSSMMRGQTPQAFRVGLIKKAHRIAQNDDNLSVTDDCGLILKYGLSKIFVVKGEEKNIKITYPLDVYIADKLFQLNNSKVSENISLNNLKGMVGVVFGGTKGIGAAIVKIADYYGAKTYAFSRGTGVDVSSENDVKKSLEQVYIKERGIDFVINTAAILKMGKIADRSIDDIKQEININYIGAVNVVKESVKYLKKTQGNILLFTSSSYTRGRALYSIYSSSKAAVVNLVQATSEEFAHLGIKINAINPERTSTPMRWEHFGKEKEDALLKPEQVAEVSLKTILSDMSGEIIIVRKNNENSI